MKNRNLISLSVTFGFLSIGITGILMYFGAHGGITTIHVIFGFIFVAVAIFHMLNNWNSLKLYTRDKKIGGIRKEFLLVNSVLILILIGSAVNLGPFAAMAHAGEEFGREGNGERAERHFPGNNSSDNIVTNGAINGTELKFIIQKGTGVPAAGKFSVFLEVNNNGVKEIYRSDVDMSKDSIYKLASAEGKLIERAIFEIKQ